MINFKVEDSSYKDKDAFVYIENQEIYRQINSTYFDAWNLFNNSGLYSKLTSEKLLVPSEIIKSNDNQIIIKPKKIFISYPWEWSFSHLKDAALLTLKIQKLSLEHGMSLKDANFFNVQFHNNNPIFIDTTSFEIYEENQPWVAYKQFCENFIAPLALMSYVDLDLKKLLKSNINGIPLALTSKLLPNKTWLNFNLLTHIHLHSKLASQQTDSNIANAKLKKESLHILIDNLIDTIQKLKLNNNTTEWADYYNNTNYSQENFEEKKQYVLEFKNTIKPKTVLDFGSNTGVFSRILADENTFVYSLDIDELAVETNYQKAKQDKENNIFPMVYDITNPSPSLGFFNKERKDLITRIGEVDLVVALALIHHLAITFNIPLEKIAKYFSSWGKYLIIEFVDKKDTKLQSMLSNRKDIFDDYTKDDFEIIFSKYYKIINKKAITSSKRTLYLMERIEY